MDEASIGHRISYQIPPFLTVDSLLRGEYSMHLYVTLHPL